MSTKNYTKIRFSASDAALVLIDQQSGVMQLVHDYSPAELRNNVVGLAKLGRVFTLPTVVTSRSGLWEHSHERDNKASHASTTVSKRLQTRFLLTKKFPLSNEYRNKSSCFEC